jgi:hypothetical protein
VYVWVAARPSLRINIEGRVASGEGDERAEHQLQDGSLAEGVGDDLEAPPLLDEQPFK